MYLKKKHSIFLAISILIGFFVFSILLTKKPTTPGPNTAKSSELSSQPPAEQDSQTNEPRVMESRAMMQSDKLSKLESTTSPSLPAETATNAKNQKNRAKKNKKRHSTESTKKQSIQDPAIVDPTQNSEANMGANFILNRFHRSETRDGRKLWEIKAERGQYFPENGTAKLHKATLWMYKKDGSQTELLAGQALLTFEGTGLLKADLSQGVVFIANKKVRVNAKEATYFKETGIVRAPGDVVIESNGMKIHGRGLTAEIEGQVYRLEKKVRTAISQKKPE